MKGVITPKDKKDLTTADILLLAMVEESINEGRTKEELKKILYAKINAIPENVLTKSDKDSRKAQIRKPKVSLPLLLGLKSIRIYMLALLGIVVNM